MKWKTALGTLLLAFGLKSSALAAEDTEKGFNLKGNISLAVADKFLAKVGIVPDDNLSLQPSVGLSASYDDLGTLSVAHWANIGGSSGKDQEHDVIVNYGSPTVDLGPLGKGKASLGWAHIESYGFTLQEVNGKLSLANPLNPSLSASYDYREGSGAYGEVAISPSLALGEGVSLDTSVAAVFNSKYFTESTKFSGVRFDVAVGKEVLPNTRFSLVLRHFAPYNVEEFKKNTSLSAAFSYDFNLVK